MNLSRVPCTTFRINFRSTKTSTLPLPTNTQYPMKPTHITTLSLALPLCLAMMPGCEKKNDPVTQASKEDNAAGVPVPGIEEIKTIAEEGFIYGLPLVMCYTAAYEFWIDRKSDQYKGPMSEIFNERRVFTYKDTAVVTPNSDTPYSFACIDLRAEPFVVSVPAVVTAE